MPITAPTSTPGVSNAAVDCRVGMTAANTTTDTVASPPMAVFAKPTTNAARPSSNQASPAISFGGSPRWAEDQSFWGKPRLTPPWLGSSQRAVTTLPRVKKCTPSSPWAWLSPKRLFFQPPNE
jgi:hypothetical protein